MYCKTSFGTIGGDFQLIFKLTSERRDHTCYFHAAPKHIFWQTDGKQKNAIHIIDRLSHPVAGTPL